MRNPKTFNEKIQWLKLYDSTPLKTRLADKYLVREWAKEKIGEEYLVPLLGVWDSFDEIDFDKLPEQFVLKANHGSGWNIIVKDKKQFDYEDAKRKFDSWLSTNYAFVSGFELHYLNIPPKIIAEEYIENRNQLYDYKIMCFNGEPKFLWVDSDRYTAHKRSLFSLDYKPLPCKVGENYEQINDVEDARPKRLEEMITIAKQLAQDFALARVDFYEISGKLYFGEITLTSCSGVDRIMPDIYDIEWGKMLTLPPKSPIPKRQ